MTGVFDGLGHAISNLTIDRPADMYVGLFGYAGVNSVIQNVGLVGGSVSGLYYVGGLVGYNSGTISNSYATGNVSGTNPVGGLVGGNSGTVSNSYWDSSVNPGMAGIGNGVTTGATGLLTSDMQKQVSFDQGSSGWDFTNTWFMYPGHTTPLLRSFMTPLTVTASNATKTYDGKPYTGIPSVSYSSDFNPAKLLGNPNYDYAAAIGAGTHTIDLYSHQQGYLITFVGTLTVDKAPLTVTANDLTKTYDGKPFSGGAGVSYSGFVNGENASQLSGTLSYGGSAQNARNAGTYTITPSGLSAANYSLSYADGALTIDKAPLTVTANNLTKTYDGKPFSGGAGVSYSGFVNGEDASQLGGTLSYGGSAQHARNAGTYAITPSGLSANNYSFSYADGALTIDKARLTVSGITASDKVYDGTRAATIQQGNLTLTGLVTGDEVIVNATATFADKNAGIGKTVNLSSSYTGADAGNYSITDQASTTASITPATLTYAATPARVFTGQVPNNLSGIVTGFVPGDTQANSTTGTLAWSTSAGAASAPGQYAIDGSGLAAMNYVFTQAAGNATALTVQPGLPPQAVRHVVAQLESQMLPPPAGTQLDKGEPLLKVINGGIRLPNNMVTINE